MGLACYNLPVAAVDPADELDCYNVKEDDDDDVSLVAIVVEIFPDGGEEAVRPCWKSFRNWSKVSRSGRATKDIQVHELGTALRHFMVEEDSLSIAEVTTGVELDQTLESA